MQQDAREYQKDDSMKKQQIIMIATVILCLALAGFTIWFALKQSAYTADKIQIAAQAWEGLKGIAPN